MTPRKNVSGLESPCWESANAESVVEASCPSGSFPHSAFGVFAQCSLNACSGSKDAYARSLSIQRIVNGEVREIVLRKDTPQADQVGFSLLMSAETNVGEDFGLIHAPLANIGDEIVHERTQDHSVGKECQPRDNRRKSVEILTLPEISAFVSNLMRGR